MIPTTKGLAHFNPKSSLDLIFSIISFTKSKNDAKEIVNILISDKYYHHLRPTIQTFRNNILKIKKVKPLCCL